MKKLIIPSFIVLLLSSCSLTKSNIGNNYSMGIPRNPSDRIPFVIDTSDKSLGYYQESYLGIKIEDIKVDGISLEPDATGIFLDDFNAGTMVINADSYIYNIQSFQILTMNNQDVISFVLPPKQKYESIVITYRARTTKGLSEKPNQLIIKN